MVLSTHSSVHPLERRVLRLTQSIVRSGSYERLSRRGTGRGRGQHTPRRRIRSQVMLERESCPHAAGHVKRSRWRGTGVQVDRLVHHKTCEMCTILATAVRTTRLGSSAMPYNLCTFCTNAVAPVHRLNSHWEIV